MNTERYQKYPCVAELIIPGSGMMIGSGFYHEILKKIIVIGCRATLRSTSRSIVLDLMRRQKLRVFRVHDGISGKTGR